MPEDGTTLASVADASIFTGPWFPCGGPLSAGLHGRFPATIRRCGKTPLSEDRRKPCGQRAFALNEALKLPARSPAASQGPCGKRLLTPDKSREPLAETFIRSLAFDLTTDQRDVLVVIESDLRQKHPMQRSFKMWEPETRSPSSHSPVIACGHSVILKFQRPYWHSNTIKPFQSS